MPDSVFVEDIAVVFDELAIITRPGAASRRVETAAVAGALARHRPLHVIEAPGTVDGGDVLVAGKQVFVGLSTRTNDHAAVQMARVLQPHGYKVREVVVHDCLHLKSAVTTLSDDLLLVNPAWIDRADVRRVRARRGRPGGTDGGECAAPRRSHPVFRHRSRERPRAWSAAACASNASRPAKSRRPRARSPAAA